MARRKITIATRKSPLALAQCRAWMKELSALGVEVAELHVTTTGDRIQDRALSEVGGKGLFIKEIEEAILEGKADAAVHSMKDVPAELAPGLKLALVSRREDPRDAIVTRHGQRFEALPAGAKVGTSSLRRAAMLRAHRPELSYVPVRGNVDTRLRKCTEGEVDAVVLAYAGMKRLGLEAQASQVFEPEQSLPAIGQGALALEIRSGDTELAHLIAPLACVETGISVAAERGVMRAVEGSCQVPVAAYALRDGAELWLRGFLAEADCSLPRFDEVRAPWPTTLEAADALGSELGKRLKNWAVD